MKARLFISVIALILYLVLFNIYIYNIHNMEVKNDKLFYNFLTVGTLIFFFLDLKCGFVNAYHKQVNLLIFLSILANYVLIIGVHSRILNSVCPIFYAFDSTVLAMTLTIFTLGIKYKTFDD